jgi:hypothetical protein
MTQDDIIRMAREAGLYEDGKFFVLEHGELTRFAALVTAAQREKLAHWMRNLGYATGHGDIKDLLDHLGTQISEGLEVEALMERMACARVCDEHASVEGIAQRCAEQIRARSKT